MLVIITLAICSAGCQEQIVHDLSEREANKVLSELHDAKVNARKVIQADGRWAVSVSKTEMFPALTHLESQRVLQAPSSRGALNAKSGFIPSREEQLFRHERVMAEAIEESLGAIPGVLQARVHLNLPAEDPVFGSSRTSTGSGSVLLLVDDECMARDEEVARLVSGAAGIPAAAVGILRSRAEHTSLSHAVSQAEVVVQQVPSAKDNDPPLQVLLLGSLGVGIGYGIRALFLRRRKRVRFALPRELVIE
jgi:type III secretory pathway lipoprotein EscJ